jgi:hypothetical protein
MPTEFRKHKSCLKWKLQRKINPVRWTTDHHEGKGEVFVAHLSSLFSQDKTSNNKMIQSSRRQTRNAKNLCIALEMTKSQYHEGIEPRTLGLTSQWKPAASSQFDLEASTLWTHIEQDFKLSGNVIDMKVAEKTGVLTKMLLWHRISEKRTLGKDIELTKPYLLVPVGYCS